MFDCEDEIYTRVKQYVDSQIKGVKWSSIEGNTPAEFPHISLYMFDCTTVKKTLDLSTHKENHSRAVIEVRYFHDNVSGNKQQLKKLSKLVDTKMIEMNCTRILYPFIQVNPSGKLEGVARYTVVVDDKKFYRG